MMRSSLDVSAVVFLIAKIAYLDPLVPLGFRASTATYRGIWTKYREIEKDNMTVKSLMS